MEYKIEIYKGDNDNRYLLGTKGNRPLVVMGVNPSTADADKPDPTIRKVIGFAEKHGYDSFVMINLYPQRATDPKDLSKTPDKSIMQQNAELIKDILLKSERPVIVAGWGTNIETRDYLKLCLFSIHLATEKYLREMNVKWIHVGDLTKNGHPKHLLYQSYDSKLNEFDVERYISQLDIEQQAPLKAEKPESFIVDNITISDVPSSRNWKEIFDFAKTVDLDKFDLEVVKEQTIYIERYFNLHNKIDNTSILELRAVLLNYIKAKKLDRDTYPTVDKMNFMTNIIYKIHNMIYDSLWDGK